MVCEAFVALDGDGGPVMDGEVEWLRTSSSDGNLSPFTASLGDGGDTAQATKRVEITQSNGIVSMTEQRSENEGADARQGGQDGGIGGFGFGRLDLQKPFFEVKVQVFTLTSNDEDLLENQSEMGGGGLEGSGRDTKRRILESVEDGLGLEPSDAMSFE